MCKHEFIHVLTIFVVPDYTSYVMAGHNGTIVIKVSIGYIVRVVKINEHKMKIKNKWIISNCIRINLLNKQSDMIERVMKRDTWTHIGQNSLTHLEGVYI